VTQAVKYFVILFAFSLSLPVYAQTSAVPAHIDASIYQRVVDENLDLRKEQARIDGEMGILRRKNASLLLDIQDLERKRDQLSALVAQLKTPDELTSQMARLNAEKVVLVREIERLRESLAANAPPMTNTPVVSVTPAPNSDLFRKLERENADLRQDMAKARAAGINESVAKEIVQKSEIALKAEVARLTAQYKDTAAELESLRRRETGLKRAMTEQAKKAFDAEQARNKALDAQVKKDEEAREAKHKAIEADAALEKLKAQTAPPENSATQSSNAPTVSDLMAAAQKSLLTGQIRDAEKLYLQAYKSEPRNASISYNLGVLYGDYLKDYEKAAKYYRNYLALAPKAVDADVVRSWLIDMTAKAKW
jgi:tetratricopeptide (TPR) repeat protein